MTDGIIKGIAVLGLAAYMSAGGFLFYGDYKTDKRYREDIKFIEKVHDKIAGKDRIMSLEEKRAFLDFIGYKGAIDENETVYLRPRGHNNFYVGIEVVIGSDLQNNGTFISGSSADSGRAVKLLEKGELEKFLQN